VDVEHVLRTAVDVQVVCVARIVQRLLVHTIRMDKKNEEV
jgi:hypothetical protein